MQRMVGWITGVSVTLVAAGSLSLGIADADGSQHDDQLIGDAARHGLARDREGGRGRLRRDDRSGDDPERPERRSSTASSR